MSSPRRALGPPLPTFVIIGAQKSATRWLRHNLGLHPDVFSARQEVKYFNHPKRCTILGSDWYREQFAQGWHGETILGEATPGYMMWRHGPADVARRIDGTLPDVRLIAVLRNPVDRAQSALVHHMKQDRVRPGTRLLDQVRGEPPERDWLGLISGGWYAASLEPYLEIFGDRLLVVVLDDVEVDAEGVFQRVLRHVGASPGFVAPSVAEVLHGNRDATTRLAPEITYAERVDLFEYFRGDVARLEQLLGRDLSRWRPGGPAPALS